MEKVQKVLGEILEIDKEYEIAIEIAMGAAYFKYNNRNRFYS